MPLAGRFGDRSHLECKKSRQDQAQADTAQAQHRIVLMEAVDRLEHSQIRLMLLPPSFG